MGLAIAMGDSLLSATRPLTGASLLWAREGKGGQVPVYVFHFAYYCFVPHVLSEEAVASALPRCNGNELVFYVVLLLVHSGGLPGFPGSH